MTVNKLFTFIFVFFAAVLCISSRLHFPCYASDGPEEPTAAQSTGATTEPAATSVPDATPVPTYNGDKIAFEVPEGGGNNNASTPGGVIMIIIVVLAIISVVSGIVEKIVKYYKNRDNNYKTD